MEQIELLSVGIDVGSSTSHLVFSNLILNRDEDSSSRRYRVTDRKIIYQGTIIDTPLIDKETIDVNELTAFFKSEYEKAGIEPTEVDTGAVIITGETAKKLNAADIVNALAEETGKFVAATAGPNFESMLAAMGSGMTSRSAENKNGILSIDIGGGTSNMAISVEGNVLSTACVSVGGRLLAVDEDGVIWRIDDPARIVMDEIGLNYHVGDSITQDEIKLIADKFADVLVEVISGNELSELSKRLMMTSNLDFALPINEISFSGGVSEFFYNGSTNKSYRDIGHYLAKAISTKTDRLIAPVVEPENKIRATVIGAGAYSLSISGSTCYLDDTLSFPLRNIPVLFANVKKEELSIDHVTTEIAKAFQRYDIEEGSQIVAIYMEDPVRAVYNRLKLFGQGVAKALPNSIANEIPIILIFKRDIGNSIGNVIRRESAIEKNLLALDELDLRDGDWIDIGEPLVNNQVFPVTVKSLVFKKQ